MFQETKANGNVVSHSYWADWLPRTTEEKKPDGTLVASHTLKYSANGDRTSDVASVQNADDHAAYLSTTTAYADGDCCIRRRRRRRSVLAEEAGRVRRPRAARPHVERSAFAGFRFPAEVITVAVR